MSGWSRSGWSRQGLGRPTAYHASSTDPYCDSQGHAYDIKLDPTLPSQSQAVVDQVGKRVGVVKRVGSQFSGDWDDFRETYASPHAAVRGYVSSLDD